MSKLFARVFGIAVAAVAAGCGNDGQYQLSGTVTYNGKPVAGGIVMLEPAEGNPGPAVTADIRTGNRSIISWLLSPLRTTVADAGHER